MLREGLSRHTRCGALDTDWRKDVVRLIIAAATAMLARYRRDQEMRKRKEHGRSDDSHVPLPAKPTEVGEREHTDSERSRHGGVSEECDNGGPICRDRDGEPARRNDSETDRVPQHTGAALAP